MLSNVGDFHVGTQLLINQNLKDMQTSKCGEH
jgi:hypothetical protein